MRVSVIQNIYKHGYLQSTKILLLPSKCEIICVTLKNGNFSNIAIAIVERALTLERETSKEEAKNWYQKGCKED